VAIEAASPMGWYRWVGSDGAFIGMTTFGESGPYKEVYEHFGITVENVVETGRSVLERAPAVQSQ
jgi:transketolase